MEREMSTGNIVPFESEIEPVNFEQKKPAGHLKPHITDVHSRLTWSAHPHFLLWGPKILLCLPTAALQA